MEAQLHSMSDYLDLNVIANTCFKPEENPYDMADEEPQRASDEPVNNVHDSTSIDILYGGVSEDEMYIGV